MDIIYLLKVLVRRRWTILSCLAFGLLAGLLIYLIRPTQYISTAQYSSAFSGTRQEGLQNETSDAGQAEFRINTVAETFKSPLTLTMVSYALLLHDLESPAPFRTLTGSEKKQMAFAMADLSKIRQILRDKLNSLKILSANDFREKMVWEILNLYGYNEESIQKKLFVDRIPKTDYINVSFRSENPELSAFVVNQIGVICRDFFSHFRSTIVASKPAHAKTDSLGETKLPVTDTPRSTEFSVRQIMPGQPSVRPVSGKGLQTVMISGLTMFFLSILAIILLELLDNTLRTPSMFKKETRINVLAGLGQIDLDKKQLSDYFHFTAGSDREQNQFPFIENLRKLRYEIGRSGKKIILFTSTSAQAGKTTVVEALANVFSLSGKKLLLIDANFGNNNLTRDFSASPGLNHFQATTFEINEKFKPDISPTPISGVQVLGCKEGNFTPSEILPKNNFLEHLQELKSDYDYIFIEGAALNTHADSKELSDCAEGILLVFSAKNSLGDTDRESIAFLRTRRQQLLGAVLNKIDEQNQDF